MQKLPDLLNIRCEQSLNRTCKRKTPRRCKFHNHTYQKLNNGFTLVELLVVIVLIGVVSAMTISIINPLTQIKKGRDSQRRSDLKLIQSALEFHISDNGYYPLSLPACNAQLKTSPPNPEEAIYLDKTPCDPKDTTTSYNYSPTTKSGGACAGTTCTKYVLWACLEYTSDLDRDANDDAGGDRCPTS